MISKKKILAAIGDVPSLPSVVIQLRQYLKDPNVNFDKLSHVIQHDPGLTANILQLANSAYFGWSRTITSVREAITRLGTDRVFQMVLCMSVAPLVRKPIHGYDTDSEGLWEHSIATAICAEYLALQVRQPLAGESFTSGLLHDLGKIVLGTFIEIDDEPIKAVVQERGLAFNEAEAEVLGIDHAEVAGELLRRWNLPDSVVSAARWHHAPESSDPGHRDLARLVHVADSLCIRVGWGMGVDAELYHASDSAFSELGIHESMAEVAIEHVTESLEDLRSVFQNASAGRVSREVAPAH